MSLRSAVNAKCRDCIVDPADIGSPAAQIACCTATTCPLHPVRPVTCSVIPRRLLDTWRISPDQLCERARPLVENAPPVSTEGQNCPLQDAKASGHSEGAA